VFLASMCSTKTLYFEPNSQGRNQDFKYGGTNFFFSFFCNPTNW
jgi:hypothetical protein